MRDIVTEHQLREVMQLTFCYLCGEAFTDEDPRTRDHVPPKSVFRPDDRSPPLILPTHEECNATYSKVDEQAKELFALLHQGPASRPLVRTEIVGIVSRDGEPSGVLLRGLKLKPMITKVLRACHAALYGAFLPEQTPNMILPPLAEFDPETHDVARSTLLPQHQIFCKMLKDNRRIGNVDRLHAYNGKFRFEVVWGAFDDHRGHFAAFAVDIYAWHRLGGNVLGRPQGCIGMYRTHDDIIPEGASVAPGIELGFAWKEPLNPFEE
jgi:hypothetical protein